MSDIDNEFLKNLLSSLSDDELSKSSLNKLDEKAAKHQDALRNLVQEEKTPIPFDPLGLGDHAPKLFGGDNVNSSKSSVFDLGSQLNKAPEYIPPNRPSSNSHLEEGHFTYMEENKERSPFPFETDISVTTQKEVSKGIKEVPKSSAQSIASGSSFKEWSEESINSKISEILLKSVDYKRLSLGDLGFSESFAKLSQITFSRPPWNASIKSLIDMNSSSKRLSLLYDNINLQMNKERLLKEKELLTSDLNQTHDDLVSELTKHRDSAIYEISDFPSIVENHYGAQRDQLNKELSAKLKWVEDYFADLLRHRVNKAIESNNDLTSSLTEINEIISRLKLDVVKMFGQKRLDSYSSKKFEMPDTEEELNLLVSQVQDFLEDMKLDNDSFYKKIIGGLFNILFYPTKLVEGDLKLFVAILNFCAVVFCVYRYNNIFFSAVTLTIIIDIMYQFYLSRVVDSGMAKSLFLAENATSIIQTLKDKFAAKERSECKSYSRTFIEKANENYDLSYEIIDSECDELISSHLSSFDEEEECQKVREVYEQMKDALLVKYNTYLGEVNADFEKSFKDIEARIENNKNQLERITPLDPILKPNSRKLSLEGFKIKIGDYTDKEGLNTVDFNREFQEGSYVVYYDNDEDKDEITKYIKHVSLQLLNHIRPEYLTVNIFDTVSVGYSFIDIISEEENISKIFSKVDDISKYIEESSTVDIQKRFRAALKLHKNVSEYNTARAANGAVTLDYKLNIFADVPSAIYKDDKFKTIVTQGGFVGFSTVAMINEKSLKPSRPDEESDKEFIESLNNFDFAIRKIDGHWFLLSQQKKVKREGQIFPNVEIFNRKSLEYSSEVATAKIKEMEELLGDLKIDSIDYSDLEGKVIPDDKVWTYDTLKGIRLCIGYKDGDLTQPEFFELGDKSPHGLMAGKTGAGKSNTINTLLLNAVRMYSPEWLELMMVDFKNVEFKMYTGRYSLPHCSLIAGTTDAEYSLSVFKTALAKMNQRKKMFANGITLNGETYSFKNVWEWNTFVLKHKIKDKYPIVPRILILIDEFQVMFKIDDDNIVDEEKRIIGRIASEARAMGIHMLFTSQSMDGTVPASILEQFALRIGLSLSPDTSKDIIGNSAASKIKRGFAIINEDASREERYNMLYKIPYIPTDYLLDNIVKVKEYGRSRTPVFHEPEFFDEELLHHEDELMEFVKRSDIRSIPNAVLLGQKVVFKPRKAPENFMMGFDDFENVLVTGNDKLDFANLINTLIVNFAFKERTKILIANFDRQLDGLLKTEFVDPDYKHLVKLSNPINLLNDLCEFLPSGGEENSDGEDSFDFFDTYSDETSESTESLISFNEESEEDNDIPATFNHEEQNRIIVFLVGLQKAKGFNDPYPEPEYEDPFKRLMSEGPANGINIVLAIGDSPLQRYASNFAYRMTAKIGEDLSFNLFSSKTAKNLLPKVGMLSNTTEGTVTKFKIYQFEYDEKFLAPKELSFDIVRESAS